MFITIAFKGFVKLPASLLEAKKMGLANQMLHGYIRFTIKIQKQNSPTYIYEVIQKMYRHHPHHMSTSGFCLNLIFYLSFTSFSKHNLDHRGNNVSCLLKQD